MNNLPTTVPTYKVFTDGSATVLSTRTGAYAAVITCPDGNSYTVCGSAAPTTISRMEMQAAITAVNWIVDQEECRDGYRIEITSDSQFFVQTVLGKYERRANLGYWALWDEVSRDLEISIRWTPRNTIEEQALCDELAGSERRTLADMLKELQIRTNTK